MNDTAEKETSTSLVTQPRQSMMQTAGAQAMVQRTLGEVQVAVMMAKQFPRDKIAAKDKLMNDCCREGLAAVSMYSYSRGGTDINGPSIRLAEAAKNAWGNMQSGWREVGRQIVGGVGFSEVEAFGWDCENNTRESLTFTVKHWRDTKSGGYALKEERDIYELCANQAARRERACILKLIDGDMIEDAMRQCQLTLATKVKATPENIASMVQKFADDFGVTKEQIEKRVQRRIEAINGSLMVSLGKIYNSLKDGMSKSADWFDPIEQAGTDENADKPEKGNEAVKEKLKKRKAKEAGADAETGEIIDAPPPPAGKMTRAENLNPGEDPGIEETIESEKVDWDADQPEPALGTVEEVKHAASTLIIALKNTLPDGRISMFVEMHGSLIVKALRDHGQGLLIGKLRALGMNIPN